MKNALTYIVFTDFDGTVSPVDIGDRMFDRFGDNDFCVRTYGVYLDGGIDAKECWRRGCATIPAVTREAFTDFALEHSIDANFKPFIDYCAGKGVSVVILSDGFDAYIDPILQWEGLGGIPHFTNSLVFNDDRTVAPDFPYTDAECDRCANCKRNHMLTMSGEDHVIVYIGDGFSDRCPARYADVVFAKGELLRYCEMNNITYHRFETFSDVLTVFRRMVDHGTPRKRRTAELARRDVFMTE